MKSKHKNFVHLVGSHTYCRMMHGAYNIKSNFLVCLHNLYGAECVFHTLKVNIYFTIKWAMKVQRRSRDIVLLFL